MVEISEMNIMYIKGTRKAAEEIVEADKDKSKFDLLSKDFLRIKEDKEKRIKDLNEAHDRGEMQNEEEIE
jgi:hypothetical protein